MIKHECVEGERKILETKTLFDEDGNEQVVSQLEYGDMQVKRDRLEAQARLDLWTNTNPQEYVAKRIEEAQKVLAEAITRYEAFGLSEAEWEELKV